MSSSSALFSRARSLNESALLSALLILLAALVVLLVLILPLGIVFLYAFEEGWGMFLSAIMDQHALHALKLTVIVAIVSVLANSVFGLCAAWSIARFKFPGRNLLLTLIDLPFAVSPIVAGLLFVLLYGINGLAAPLLQYFDIHIIFAIAGVILATIFVTLPFVVRELVPILEEQGASQDEAALTMGASGWQMFWYVTLPNVRWGLFYGIVLTNARAMGEFGAVSVVSGHLRGETNTLPLHIEILYNEFNTQAAFACAAVLSCLALITLLVKTAIELRQERKQIGA